MADSNKRTEATRPALSHLAVRLSVGLILFVVVALLLADSTTQDLPPGQRQRQLVRFSVVALLAGISLAALIDTLVTRPVFSLLSQVRKASVRNWDQPIKVPSNRGEISELGQALEDLRKAVNERTEALNLLNNELEDRVRARSRELEEAQQQLLQAAKLAALGQLAAGVAHEVNNPTGILLTRIGYLLSVAEEQGMGDELVADLKTLEDQAKRISTITQNLLRFGRKSALNSTQCSLNDIVKLTASLLNHKAKASNVALKLELGEQALAYVDRPAIEQVCFNLIKNAIEAGATKVWVRTGPGHLQVQDNGPGMNASTRERIFEPFFTTKEVGEGSGLGLSVSYGIVERHGGQMRVSSEEGVGSTFDVNLPQTGVA
jgi:two-component system NtrC family sensor kinase